MAAKRRTDMKDAVWTERRCGFTTVAMVLVVMTGFSARMNGGEGGVSNADLCDAPPAAAPTDQSEDLDHFAADWGVFCDLGTVTYEVRNVTTPSLDGLALECSLTGAVPFAGLHCYRNLLSEPDSTFFRVQLDFLFSDTTCN
ncbi:MAG: hypothetical protein V3T72_19810, partial [Thermoanaerobaculia bacterium]